MYMRVKLRRHNESQSVAPNTSNVILINQSSPIARKELIEEGRKSIGKVFVLAMVLEVIHQVITQYLVFLQGHVLSPRSPWRFVRISAAQWNGSAPVFQYLQSAVRCVLDESLKCFEAIAVRLVQLLNRASTTREFSSGGRSGQTEELVRISCQLLAISILSLTPLASMAQDVVPYANSDVKVDWVRGTDFSKYKTYAWGTSHLATPSLEHTVQGMIDAALQEKGLQKVGMDADPGLVVAFSSGNKLVYSIQGSSIVKEGTFVLQLADPQLKKSVWWSFADDTVTDNPDKDVPLIQKRIENVPEVSPASKEMN